MLLHPPTTMHRLLLTLLSIAALVSFTAPALAQSGGRVDFGDAVLPVPGPIIYGNQASHEAGLGPTHENSAGIGGLRIVEDIAARDAIPPLFRAKDMVVIVRDAGAGTPQAYTFLSNAAVTNADWVVEPVTGNLSGQISQLETAKLDVADVDTEAEFEATLFAIPSQAELDAKADASTLADLATFEATYFDLPEGGSPDLTTIDTETEFESQLFALTTPAELTAGLSGKLDVTAIDTRAELESIAGGAFLLSGEALEAADLSGTAPVGVVPDLPTSKITGLDASLTTKLEATDLDTEAEFEAVLFAIPSQAEVDAKVDASALADLPTFEANFFDLPEGGTLDLTQIDTEPEFEANLFPITTDAELSAGLSTKLETSDLDTEAEFEAALFGVATDAELSTGLSGKLDATAIDTRAELEAIAGGIFLLNGESLDAGDLTGMAPVGVVPNLPTSRITGLDASLNAKLEVADLDTEAEFEAALFAIPSQVEVDGKLEAADIDTEAEFEAALFAIPSQAELDAKLDAAAIDTEAEFEAALFDVASQAEVDAKADASALDAKADATDVYQRNEVFTQGETITQIETRLRLPSASRSGSVTVPLAWEGFMNELSDESAQTISMPTDASAAFAVGTVIYMKRTSSAGDKTITNQTGATVDGGCTLSANRHIATVRKTGSNAWAIEGCGAAAGGTADFSTIDTEAEFSSVLFDVASQAEAFALANAAQAAAESYADANDTQRSDEEIRDVSAAQLVGGTNVTVSVDDAGNTVTINSSAAGASSIGAEVDPSNGPAVAAMETDKLYWRSGTGDLLVKRGNGDLIPFSGGSPLAYDATAPTIDVFEVTESGGTFSLTVSADEALATIQANVDEPGIGTGAVTSWTDQGSFAYTATYAGGTDGTYVFTLAIAEDAAGNDGAASQQVSLGLDTSAPAAPSNVVVTAGDNAYTVTCDANVEGDLAAQPYRFHHSTTQGGPYSFRDARSTCSYGDVSVVNGTSYYVVVTAIDASGNESAYSAEQSVTPTAPSSSGVEALDAVCSTRLAIGSYSGPLLRVRRSSDDAEADVCANGSGYVGDASPIDTDGDSSCDDGDLDTWVGASDALVASCYDQLEGGTDFTQPVTGRQPPLYTSGTLFTGANGQAAIEMPVDDTGLEYGAAVSAPYAQFIRGRMSESSETRFLSDGAASDGRNALYVSFGSYNLFAGSTVTSSVSSDNGTHVFYGLFNGASSQIGVDGTYDPGDAGTEAASTLIFGNYWDYVDLSAANGYVQEIGLHFGTPADADRDAAVSDMSNF